MRISLIAISTFIIFTLFGANVMAQTSSVTQRNPERLLSFAAAKNSGNILISWKVKKESDSTMFAVEKSIDTGKTFQSIGAVKSNGTGIYSFADDKPATGQGQYRLKMQDDHGNSSYSNALILLFQPMNMISNKIRLYPNPINHSINQDVTGDDDTLDMSPVSTQ
jgi:hypothetical protein